jgi:hypothetical protein
MLALYLQEIGLSFGAQRAGRRALGSQQTKRKMKNEI